MDLVMRKISTGEEKIVPYDFDFNIGSDGKADFEIAVPMEDEVWDMFYVDNYHKDCEYAGFVTDISIQTNGRQKVVKGNTLRYYMWSSVLPRWNADTEGTISAGYSGSMALDVIETHLKLPIQIYQNPDWDQQACPAITYYRNDSVDSIIQKICANVNQVFIPRFVRDENTPGDSGFSFTMRSPKIYYPRIDDGEVGGTGEATLDTSLHRKVVVIAEGQGEGSARTMRAVWYDGTNWHTNQVMPTSADGYYEEYLLDYSNAESVNVLVNKAKEIAQAYWDGKTSMSASELEIEPGATIGDSVYLTGAVEYQTTITGMILKRQDGVTTEEFTYAASDTAPSVGNAPDTTGIYAGSATKGGSSIRTAAIPYGIVDSTSTSTAFTATVRGITSLYDGVAVWLKNGVVTSAAGFTININGLGAKPVYTNLAAATAESTKFNINYTMLFIFDSTRVAGGCWVCYNGYDSNTNTIGYQLRTNSSTLKAKNKGYRYRLWFTSADGSAMVPANVSTSTNATTARSLNTEPIDPFGRIFYYSSNATTDAGGTFTTTTLWDQYTLTIGYSYVKSLTSGKPVYLKCTPQANGGAVMSDIVQALPSSADGYIYIFLGVAYSTTNLELYPVHPVYYYAGGGIRLYSEGMVDVSSSLTAGTNVNLGSNCHAWKKGDLCFVTLNMQITGSITSGATLVSGLPTNSSAQVSFAAALGGTSTSAAMRIQGGASVITADGAISTTGWYDASFVYVMG